MRDGYELASPFNMLGGADHQFEIPHLFGAFVMWLVVYKVRWWIHVRADTSCAQKHQRHIISQVKSEEGSEEYQREVLAKVEDFYGSHRIQNRVSDIIGGILTWGSRILFCLLFAISIIFVRAEDEPAFIWIFPVGVLLIFSARAAIAYLTFFLTWRYPGQAAAVRETLGQQ